MRGASSFPLIELVEVCGVHLDRLDERTVVPAPVHPAFAQDDVKGEERGVAEW